MSDRSALKGEDTGEGARCGCPLTLALFHKGRGNLKLSVRGQVPFTSCGNVSIVAFTAERGV